MSSTLEKAKLHIRKLTNLKNPSLSSCLNFRMSSPSTAMHLDSCFAERRLGTCSKLKAKDGLNRLTCDSQRHSMDPSHKMPMQCCWSSFCTGNISMCSFEMDYYEMGFAFFLLKSLLSIVFLKKSKGCVPLWCVTKRSTSPCWEKGFAKYCCRILWRKLH